MALAIKMRLSGKKHQRYFRVVVAEKRSKLQGKYTDDLGWVNPHTGAFGLDQERTRKWIGSGALPTDTVHNFLVRAGVVKGPKRSVHNRRAKKGKGSEAVPAQSGAAQGVPADKPLEVEAAAAEKKAESAEGEDQKSEER